MTESDTARVLGISPKSLAAWRQWLAFWSVRYVEPSFLPVTATVAPLPQQPAFQPTTVGYAAPWVDTARVSAACEPVEVGEMYEPD